MKLYTVLIRLFFILIIITGTVYPYMRLTATPYGFVESDVSYSTAQKNVLDLYIPRQDAFSINGLEEQHQARRNYPVVLFIHGGSFTAGDRKEYPYKQIGEAFQKMGIGCAVMSYRLMQDSVWPAQPRDAAKAVRWLKENIRDYGGDPERIIIAGHSAGGHLAALISTDSAYLSESGLSLRDIAGSVVIGSMMSDAGSLNTLSAEEEQRLFRSDWFFKIFGSKKNFQNSLPISHINPSMPPMLIMLGDGELYDPPKQQSILDFISASRQYQTPVEYQVIANRTHMETVEQMVNAADPAMKNIVRFISGL